MNYKNVINKTLVWNAVSNLLFGFQSVLILVILTRTVGIEESGIFTLAYANASLFLLVGKYSVRNYHVSDVTEEHTFGDYRIARVITVVAMCVTFGISLFYTAQKNGYSQYKNIIMILLCAYKVPDAIEDVYFGEFQRQGRLDVAAQIMSFRLLISIASLAVSAVLTHNLGVSLIISVILSFLSMYFMLVCVKKGFRLEKYKGASSVKGILIACFPLFLGSFLSQYLSNAPKYAIDAHLSNEIQACYGFISMPVFVIGLLNNIIFSPVIYRMSKFWKDGDIADFWKRFVKQVIIIGILAAIILLGAWFLGIPVLSLLYSMDLNDYKTEFMVLLFGGVFQALSGLLTIMLTIMRLQYTLLTGYLTVSLLAGLFCGKMVIALGVFGAAIMYSGLMLLLAVFFLAIFLWNLKMTLLHKRYQ